MECIAVIYVHLHTLGYTKILNKNYSMAIIENAIFFPLEKGHVINLLVCTKCVGKVTYYSFVFDQISILYALHYSLFSKVLFLLLSNFTELAFHTVTEGFCVHRGANQKKGKKIMF